MVRFLCDTQIVLWLDFYMIHHGGRIVFVETQ